MDSQEETETSCGWGNIPTEPEQPIIWREIYHDYIPTCTRIEAIHLEDKMWKNGVRVFLSSPEVWELFLSTPHDIVGIDCEGISTRSNGNERMPLLITISSPTMVILHFPFGRDDYIEEKDTTIEAGDKQDVSGFHPSFLRILMDPNIIKVIFDPSGEKRAIFSDAINTAELLQSITSSELSLPDRDISSLTLVDLLHITTGKIYEVQSRAAKGWVAIKSIKTMKQNKRYLIHCAANVWGILFSYLSLTRVLLNSLIEPPRSIETS